MLRATLRGDVMGLFDKLKKTAAAAEKELADHPNQVREAMSKVGGIVDAKTGGTHHNQIVQAESKADEFIEKKVQP
jgi:MT0933-like antitoxin protein